MLGQADKHAIALHQGTPLGTIYLEVPSDDRVIRSTSLPTRLFMAEISPTLEWVEFVTAGPVKLPGIVEQGRGRFVRVAAGARAPSSCGRSEAPRDAEWSSR